MKIVLISPPFMCEGKIVHGKQPPLGLGYIAAVLENRGYAVSIVDLFDYSRIRSKLKRENPDIIGISINMTAFYPEAVKVANIAKECLGDIKIIVGGYHPTAVPEKTLANPSFDIAVLGEGEYAFPNLIKGLERSEIRKISGIAYRDNGKIIINRNVNVVKNLDMLPWPARHLLPMDRYNLFIHSRGRKYTASTMVSSRGCPYNCIFCVSPKIFRVRDPKDVVDEMGFVCEKFDVEGITFMDDMFGLKANWTIKFCREILKRKLDIAWSCISRCDVLSKERLNLMAKSGCKRIEFGVETGDPVMMHIIRKGESLEQVEKAIKNSDEEGIQAHAFFMLGNPGESKVSIDNTRKFARRLCKKYGASASFAITEVYPGSDLEKMLDLNHDWLDPINPNYMSPNIPTYPNASGMFSLDQMKKIRDALWRECMTLTWERPEYVFNRLKSQRSISDIPTLVRIIAKYAHNKLLHAREDVAT